MCISVYVLQAVKHGQDAGQAARKHVLVHDEAGETSQGCKPRRDAARQLVAGEIQVPAIGTEWTTLATRENGQGARQQHARKPFPTNCNSETYCSPFNDDKDCGSTPDSWLSDKSKTLIRSTAPSRDTAV